MPSHDEEDKPCRACNDFRTWAKQQKPKKGATSSTNVQSQEKSGECPLDKDELGRSTWGFLHSMASYYPDKPTSAQSQNMTKFFNIFAEFYPCEPCAIDFKEDMKKHPPKTNSKNDLAKWLCERHNTINIKLGKPVFDCSKVHERWRDGWSDGSCD